jgi:hypothetical protein
MKTNEQKRRRYFASGNSKSEKRMWITRKQINIAKWEIESMRGYLWKLCGAAHKPTGFSFAAGGSPVGEWVYGCNSYDNSTSEQAEQAMRNRRKQDNERRKAGRISIGAWNQRTCIV